MVNVTEQTSLGSILSEIKSHMKNTLSKHKQLPGIIKNIVYLVRGLGKHTFEGCLTLF